MSPRDTTRAPSELWKDRLNRKFVSALAVAFGKVYPRFDHSGFVGTVLSDGFLNLELKARINRVAISLRSFLPDQYEKATRILVKIAPHVATFENWILTAYVEQFGLDHFDRSVAILKNLTKHGTSEFAIRPFVNARPREMIRIMTEWTADKNEHIRRLAAEGSRPRGVWTIHIDEFRRNPKPVLKLLDKLCTDPSKYVRIAVANNLNDISRDNPDLAIETAKRWSRKNNDYTQWIVRHGCRSLIKAGDPRIFPILGFADHPAIEVSAIQFSSGRVSVGESVEIYFAIKSRSTKPQKLAIDYRIDYFRGDKKPASKIFKLTEKTLSARSVLNCSKRHAFRDTRGRTHIPGEHGIEIIINGRPSGQGKIKILK